MRNLISPLTFRGPLRQKLRLWRQAQFPVRHSRIQHEKLVAQCRRFDGSPFARVFEPWGIGHAIDACTMIDTDRRFVYCRVPKAATSTVVRSMHHAETGETEFDGQTANFMKTERFARPSELDEETARSLADFFRFTIVRNPFARTLSAYSEKVLPTNDRRLIQRREAALFLGKGPGDPISFPEFLDFLEYGGGLFMNRHWARQVDVIAFRPDQLSFVGKVESLDRDLPQVIERIFGKASGILDWRPHQTHAGKASDALDPASRARIYKLYRDDFETFGYGRT